MKASRWVALVAGVLVLAAAGYYALTAGPSLLPRPAGAQDGESRTATIQRRDIGASVLAIGVIRPRVGAEVQVGSRASGILRRLHVTVGDRVSAGQLLAELDPTEFQARVDQAAAQLQAARGGLGRLGWLMRVHTLGLAHRGAQETQLLVNTDKGAVEIRLGPTAFVKQKGVEIKDGDTLEVIGSRVTLGDSDMVLAREIRKGATAWTFRDTTGQPLWSSAETQSRRFWTKNKIIVISIVAAKVVALSTVLRH